MTTFSPSTTTNKPNERSLSSISYIVFITSSSPTEDCFNCYEFHPRLNILLSFIRITRFFLDSEKNYCYIAMRIIARITTLF